MSHTSSVAVPTTTGSSSTIGSSETSSSHTSTSISTSPTSVTSGTSSSVTTSGTVSSSTSTQSTSSQTSSTTTASTTTTSSGSSGTSSSTSNTGATSSVTSSTTGTSIQTLSTTSTSTVVSTTAATSSVVSGSSTSSSASSSSDTTAVAFSTTSPQSSKTSLSESTSGEASSSPTRSSGLTISASSRSTIGLSPSSPRPSVTTTVTTTGAGGRPTTITTVTPSGTLAPVSDSRGFTHNAGALAGLVIGITAAVVLVALGVYFLLRRRFGPAQPPVPPANNTRRQLDHDEMVDASGGLSGQARIYGAIGTNVGSGEVLLDDADTDPEGLSSQSHGYTMSQGHSLYGRPVAFAPMPAFPLADAAAADAPHSPTHSSSAGAHRTGSSSHGHASYSYGPVSQTGHDSSSPPGGSSHGHSNAGSSHGHSTSFEGARVWWAQDLPPPQRPSLAHDSSGSGSGMGTASGSGTSSQPLLQARPPSAPPSSYPSQDASRPGTPSRGFSLRWRPRIRGGAPSGSEAAEGSSAPSTGKRRSQSVNSPPAPTFFEATPRPTGREPAPSGLLLPPRPAFFDASNLPFPSPDVLTPDGLLNPEIRRVGTQDAALASAHSLRDDMDYSRPIVARMYTSTTLDSLHHTNTVTRSSIASEHGSEHSVWSAPSADHDHLHDGPYAYEPTMEPENEATEMGSGPPIVVESPPNRSNDPSPVEGDHASRRSEANTTHAGDRRTRTLPIGSIEPCPFVTSLYIYN
ncbi:unnamed protein product [Peniophora sp. CBMAI 1063]|nr:unnamed protein product [Peniophora sp. CBMAI 1063]